VDLYAHKNTEMMSYPAHDSAVSYAIGNAYDTDNEEDEYDEELNDDQQFKRRKLTEDERLQRWYVFIYVLQLACPVYP
jgi:hypothetical protein